MRGAGNPRIGGFPRSWVAPAVQPPSSLSLSLNFARRLYLCAGKEKRRSLCFGNWPNPAMFSICCKGKAARAGRKRPSSEDRFLRGKLQRGNLYRRSIIAIENYFSTFFLFVLIRGMKGLDAGKGRSRFYQRNYQETNN